MDEKVLTNCTVGGPVYVHVKNGKMVRVRPLIYSADDPKGWTIRVGEKSFSPIRKATIAPYIQAAKRWVYSKNRILYPLKRVDFNAKGDRHTENRGKSGYERISWDEALDIVAGEIERVKTEYGDASSIMMTEGSHMNWGNIGYRFSTYHRFMNLVGRSVQFDNPDSWEGWHWGATHAYGFYWRLGAPEQYDLLEDAMKNTELFVVWSGDPDSTRGIYGGQDGATWRLWLKELGKKIIFIDPFCNYTATILADKWIAPRPGTDTALAAAIAYVWIKEDTYDKDYVAKRTFGFEAFRDYIMGKEDGVPKTSEWAEEKTLIPARVIRALAREWASKRTMLSCGSIGGWGGACRTSYAHEWTRYMVLLQAMQGYGKPGVNIWSFGGSGAPINSDFFFPGYAEGGISGDAAGLKYLVPRGMVKVVTGKPPGVAHVQKLNLPEAINGIPHEWYGEGFCGASVAQQFLKYKYPSPEGHPQVHLFHRFGASFFGIQTNVNRWVGAYKNPRLEFFSCQTPHFGGEAQYCDIILPACTNFERNDIGEWANCSGYIPHVQSAANFRVIVYMKKCIEPLGESKSDYDICTLMAERLGFKELYTENNNYEDWIKRMYEVSDLPKYIAWDEFVKKGYFIVPFPDDYKSTPAMRWFYENRQRDTPDWGPNSYDTPNYKKSCVATPSGKIEFLSQSLQRFAPDDEERPPVPKYIPSWEGHETDVAKKYPLALISPHPRFSFHTQYDFAHHPWLDEIPHHRIVKDGYAYWTIRINPKDASARGIKHKDVVKVYNDRGAVLCVAYVTERASPGALHSYESCGQYDPLEPGKPGSIDRAGCVNLLTSERYMSKRATGMAPNSCLVEVEKWKGN